MSQSFGFEVIYVIILLIINSWWILMIEYINMLWCSMMNNLLLNMDWIENGFSDQIWYSNDSQRTGTCRHHWVHKDRYSPHLYAVHIFHSLSRVPQFAWHLSPRGHANHVVLVTSLYDVTGDDIIRFGYLAEVPGLH